jgi:hypothetical protein
MAITGATPTSATSWRRTFRLRMTDLVVFVALVVLGLSAWPRVKWKFVGRVNPGVILQIEPPDKDALNQLGQTSTSWLETEVGMMREDLRSQVATVEVGFDPVVTSFRGPVLSRDLERIQLEISPSSKTQHARPYCFPRGDPARDNALLNAAVSPVMRAAMRRAKSGGGGRVSILTRAGPQPNASPSRYRSSLVGYFLLVVVVSSAVVVAARTARSLSGPSPSPY